MTQARVEGIYVAAKAGELPRPVDAVNAVAGRGLDGDRNFSRNGSFSKARKEGRDLTLIEAEAIEGLAADTGIELEPGASRRNVVTRGIDLNALVGRRFRVGEVECLGQLLCPPCSHLEKLTQPGVLKGLADRGGLRADIVNDGRIAVGDPVVELAD